jgi:multidrug efflux system membrane fusion protein
VDPGNVVHSAEATPIISVTQIQPIAVTFTLPQDNLPAIVEAMEKGPLDVVVYTGDNKLELDRGTLLTPDNTIDGTTGTIKLKAIFANSRRTLWPGQFVNAKLLVGTDTNVVSVPAVSVQHGPSGLYVYQIGPHDVVSVEPIKVVRQEGDVYIVSEGVAEGAVIVATGQSRLQAGLHVVFQDQPPDRAKPSKSGS